MIGPRVHRLRIALFAAALAAATLVGCAEKAVMPTSAASPRFLLRVNTQGVQLSAGQKLAVFAVYFSNGTGGNGNGNNGNNNKQDSIRFLDTVLVSVTGPSQDVSLKIDLTQCLADPARSGSHDACSMYVGAFLVPDSYTFTSGGDVTGLAYDYKLLGPFDVVPGKPPTVPAFDLSVSRFAINHFEGDDALQLGGEQTPQFFSGPITGVSNPSGPPTLFALTNGGVVSGSGQSQTFQFVAQLAVFQNGTWRRVTGPVNNNFVDVAAFSPTDAYIAGADGLYHYDGSTISAVSAVREPLRSVAVATANGAKVLVAGTNAGNVWFSNGLTNFTKAPTGTSSQIDGVCINSATEAFATNRSSGALFRFDGNGWTATSASQNGSRSDLQCLGPGQAYVATQSIPNTLLKWNGSSWTQLVTAPPTPRGFEWAVVSPTEVYAIGDSSAYNRAFYRYDGSTWREVGRTSFSINLQTRPWADPKGAIYAASSTNNATRIDVASATGVTQASVRPALRDLVMPTSSSAFIVGSNGFLAHLSNGQWIADPQPSTSPMNQAMQGVWADGASNAWAVGASSAIFHWDGTSWSTVSDVKRPVATADNYSAVSGSGGTVFVVGEKTILRCRSTVSCANDANPASSAALLSVWAASATNVFATGEGGRIIHFDGTSWSSMSSPTSGRLSRVWGSGPGDVWAAGDTVVLHYNGSAWSNVTRSIYDSQQNANYQQQSGPFQIAGWSASSQELYLGAWYGRVTRLVTPFSGEVAGPFDPPVGRILGLSGPSGGCALAVTDGSAVLGGPILLRGVGPNGCLGQAFRAPIVWP